MTAANEMENSNESENVKLLSLAIVECCCF